MAQMTKEERQFAINNIADCSVTQLMMNANINEFDRSDLLEIIDHMIVTLTINAVGNVLGEKEINSPFEGNFYSEVQKHLASISERTLALAAKLRAEKLN